MEVSRQPDGAVGREDGCPDGKLGGERARRCP